MTGKQDTAKIDPNKWVLGQAVIESWLRDPAAPRISVGRNYVGPPRAGELSDGDIEELRDKAIDKWLLWLQKERPPNHQTPEYEEGRARIEAARALGNWRKAQARRREIRETLKYGAAPGKSACQVETIATLNGLKASSSIPVRINGRGSLRQLDDESLSTAMLKSELSQLASRFELAWRHRPYEQELQELGSILRALSHPKFDKTDKLGGIGRDFLRRNNSGPRTRVQEAAAFCSLLQRLQAMAAPAPVAAKTIVQRLGSWPQLAAMGPRRVFVSWFSPEFDEAVKVVEQRWPREPMEAKALARTVLEGLGVPRVRTKGLFDADRKARSRRKKKADT